MYSAMKNRLIVLFALVALLVGAFGASAQDDLGTIADIVVASAGAETPEFTVLLAAVSAADPMFLEELSRADANYTVFAPTDAAFGAALEALGVTAEELLGRPDILGTVLSYHIVPGRFDAASVVALDGALLGTTLPETALPVALDGENVTVGGATVVAADVLAANGIVHVIDSVLLPVTVEEAQALISEPMMEGEEMMEEPMSSLAESLIAASELDMSEFTILLAAVQGADPLILAEALNGGPYTIFAPTNAAFEAAIAALGTTPEDLLNNSELLTTVLAYHVVPGYFTSGTVVAVAGAEGGATIATALPGTTVSVALDGESVMVNDATVTAVDVLAGNGVIHVIDTVLLPPAGE
jgi:uncharacterized surface protein with fasciclin (FAS1) repeats